MKRRIPLNRAFLAAAILVVSVMFLTATAGQAKRKPPVRKGKVATVMLTDHEIKDALTEGADIALVKVASINEEAKGTRSHRTHYQLNLEQNVVGTRTGTIEAVRYGAAVLQPQHWYVVVLLDSQRFGMELLSFVAVPAEKRDEAVKAHAARVAKLRAAK